MSSKNRPTRLLLKILIALIILLGILLVAVAVLIVAYALTSLILIILFGELPTNEDEGEDE